MNNNPIENPPKSDSSDAAYAGVRAGLSSIPLLGGLAVEVYQVIVKSPLEKRWFEWAQDLAEAVNELQKRGITLEDLQNNDVFVDTVIKANRIAYTSSQKEKREALKNAIFNSGLPNPPEQSLQQIFLNLIDSFTVWHLRLLKLYQNPIEWGKANNVQFDEPEAGERIALIEKAFPELKGREWIYTHVWNELYHHELVEGNALELGGLVTKRMFFKKLTTQMGDQFLIFIEKHK